MKLDQYISELLFEHECVIVPGFGGIVANYRSSFLNPARHTFSPPSKKLAFNASLRTNDGLLASHLCKSLSVSYNEANNYIKDFVADCTHALESGEKLILEKVGVIYLDQEKNLQFMPDSSVNYLKSSFGLFTLHSPPVLREAVQSLPLIPEIGKKTKKKVRIASWRLIELVPVAAILGLMILNPSVISRLNEQFASINPFSKTHSIESSAPVPQADKASSAYIIGEEEEQTETAPEVVNNGTSEASIIPEEVPVIKMKPDLLSAELPAPETPVKEESVTVPASSQKLFYVIGGCFRMEENADKFLHQALNDGHQAAIIGRNKNGLIMVSLFTTDNREKALTELAAVKEKSEAGAWLLHQ